MIDITKWLLKYPDLEIKFRTGFEWVFPELIIQCYDFKSKVRNNIAINLDDDVMSTKNPEAILNKLINDHIIKFCKEVYGYEDNSSD